MEIAQLNEDRFLRGLVSSGLSEPLLRFRAKLASGQPMTYGAIGGSITAGAAASDPVTTSYGALFAEWLNDKTSCKFVNAGVGATTSMFGAFRAQQDMLCYSPDLITVEFAVNDVSNPDIEASYEALVRQCVDSPNKPLVILLFTMRRDGVNVQDQQIPCGAHYGLPMLSYRDALYPDIDPEKLPWQTISPDDVHPNDVGHAFIASMLIRFMETAEAQSGSQALPDLLVPDAIKYLEGRVADGAHLDIVENLGWTPYDHGKGYYGLKTNSPGAQLKIRVQGGTLLLGYVKYAGDFGMASVKVDGVPVCKLDGFYEKPEVQEWAGGHVVLESICDETPGTEHVVEITLLDETHVKSTGHDFKVVYLLAGK